MSSEGQRYPLAIDYTDEPLGLPRGTYRRIERRHTITPHEKGFRFRPIGPDEQQRVREKSERDGGTYTETRQPQRGANGWEREHRADRPQPAIKFRPDKRLDKGAGHPVERYAYPSEPGLPQFRPE